MSDGVIILFIFVPHIGVWFMGSVCKQKQEESIVSS